MRRMKQVRSGTTVVESALVYPATLILLLGIIVGGMGIYRYQEVASLARAAARYASTHGAQYRKDTGMAVGSPGSSTPSFSNNTFWFTVNPTQTAGSDTSWAGSLYDNAVRSNLVSLDPASVQFQVGWPPVINQSGKPDNWPGSRVSVILSYQWLPELLFIGPINLTSTSSMSITN